MSTKTAVATANPIPTSPVVVAARGKKRSSSTFSSGDERKKQRGRPRVEPQDETAADRRRTQIRLAQRSYRQRKEGTITDLQSKVSQLESIISEMNETCQDLHQDISKQGGHKADESFSRKFADAAERFMELTRSAKRQRMGRSSSSDDSNSDPSERPLSRSKNAAKRSPVKGSPKNSPPQEPTPPTPTIVSTDERGVPSVWGYETIYQYPGGAQMPSNTASSGPHEVPSTISQPVYNNNQAIVPSDYFQLPLGPPTPIYQQNSFFFFNPGSEITLPMSYANMEYDFGRRIGRYVVEAGVRLLSMQYPPPKRVREVFGHVMKYYGQQQLRDLLIAGLRTDPNEPLESKAVYPYAGPLASQDWSIQMLDDQARSDIVNQSNDKEGWYLPNDIETFLQRKGIVVPIGASFVDWEFGEFVPMQPAAPPWPSPAASNNGDVSQDGSTAPLDLNRPEYQQNPMMQPMSGGEMPTSQPAHISSDGMVSYGLPQGNTFYPPNYIPQHHSNMAPKAQLVPQKFTLDLNKLMDELRQVATCLGKTPGFRRFDVETAFTRSLIPVATSA